LPPLTITAEVLKEGLDILETVLAETREESFFKESA